MSLTTRDKPISINIRVDERLKSRLLGLARESKREFSDYMRLALEEIVEQKIKIK